MGDLHMSPVTGHFIGYKCELCPAPGPVLRNMIGLWDHFENYHREEICSENSSWVSEDTPDGRPR